MWRALVFLLVIAMASNVYAAGHDSDIPKPDPKGYWRIVTMDNATSTSKCIGDPKTPICAIDTLWAAFNRQDPNLYEMVARDPAPPWKYPPPSDSFDKYRIASAKRLRLGDLKEQQQASRDIQEGPPWKIGDVKIVIQICGRRPACDNYPYSYMTYIVRSDRSGWKFVTWFDR